MLRSNNIKIPSSNSTCKTQCEPSNLTFVSRFTLHLCLWTIASYPVYLSRRARWPLPKKKSSWAIVLLYTWQCGKMSYSLVNFAFNLMGYKWEGSKWVYSLVIRLNTCLIVWSISTLPLLSKVLFMYLSFTSKVLFIYLCKFWPFIFLLFFSMCFNSFKWMFYLRSITLAGVRRLLEEDLGLEKNTLDAFKKFIQNQVDEVGLCFKKLFTSKGGVCLLICLQKKIVNRC